MQLGDRSKPVAFIVQDEVSQSQEPCAELRAGGHVVRSFSSADPGWKDLLIGWDKEWGPECPQASGTGVRAALFVSLEVASFIRKNCTWLSRYLILDEGPLHFHRFSGLLPTQMLLNRSFVLMPFGALMGRRDQLRALYGSELFIRPDSPMKPFAGSPVSIDDLDTQIETWRRANVVFDDLLVVVDQAQKISDIEFRFWLADGDVVTSAPYAHSAFPHGRAPQSVTQAARSVARHLEATVNPVVADFALDTTGTPRLVELNAFSTSGIYKGLDMEAIAQILDEMLY